MPEGTLVSFFVHFLFFLFLFSVFLISTLLPTSIRQTSTVVVRGLGLAFLCVCLSVCHLWLLCRLSHVCLLRISSAYPCSPPRPPRPLPGRGMSKPTMLRRGRPLISSYACRHGAFFLSLPLFLSILPFVKLQLSLSFNSGCIL